MRNLKKILALVLSLMMVLSVMVTASAADFSDADEIQYTEAVEVMTGLGILNGIPDGSFAPKATLERAQAAKIIAFMKLGAEGIKDLDGTGSAKFTDVLEGSWAYDYVSYCADTNIVSGYEVNGEWNFGPKGTLTGYQFGKMALVALGYDAENYKGSGWELRVAQDAKAKGLLAGLADGFSLKNGLTREEACQIALNAMLLPPAGSTATTIYVVTVAGVEHEFTSATEAYFYATSNNTTVSIKESAAKDSMYADNFNGKVATIAVESNDALDADAAGTTSGGTLTAGTDMTFKMATGLEAIGHVYKVYYQTVNGVNVPYAYFDLSKVITVDEDQEKLSAADVKALLGITVDADDYTVLEMENYEAGSDSDNYITYDSTTKKYEVAAGEYIVYNNDQVIVSLVDSDVKVLTVTLDAAGKTDKYSVTDGGDVYVDINGDDTDADLVKSDKDIDWTALVTSGTTATAVYLVTEVGDYYYLNEVQSVVGKITKTSVVSGNSVLYIDGNPYLVNYDATSAGALGATGLTVGADVAFGTEYRFFLDEYSCIFGAKSTAEAPVVSGSSLFYATYFYSLSEAIDDFGGTVVTYYVQGVDGTGAEVRYQITQAVYQADNEVNKLYTVTVAEGEDADNDDLTGDYATLTDLPTAGATGAATVAGATASTAVAATSKKVANNFYYASDVKFIYVTGSASTLKTTVVDGVKALAANAAYWYYGTKAESATNYDVKFVFINASKPADPDATGTGIMAAFETADSATTVPYTKADGTIGTAYIHVVYIDGVKTEIMTASAAALTGFTAYTVSAQGLYAQGTTYSAVVSGAISNNYNGAITVDTAEDKDVTNATIVNVSGNKLADSLTATTLAATETVSLVLDAAGNVVVIYITASTRS